MPAGIRAAVAAGSVSADAVAIEARKHAAAATAGTAEPAGVARTAGSVGPQRSRAAVVTLGARRQAALPPEERPTPSVREYDQLLGHGAGEARS